jgi:hypothetical protein
MGLVFDQVSFDGRAPDLLRIADKVTELCGLPVTVKQSGDDIKQNLYDQHGYIAFACAEQDKLELFSYRPGAVRQFYEESFEGLELPMAKFVTGLNEPAGTQVVYLRGTFGLETLMGVTALALEALGGRPSEPMEVPERREYGRRITEAELLQRRRRWQQQGRWALLIGVLLLPVSLPLFLLGLLVTFALMPWRIWKAWQLTRATISKRDHEKLPSGR